MSNSQHRSGKSRASADENVELPQDDAGDRSGTSFAVGKDGATPVEKAAGGDGQDESAIEAFGEEGAGIAAKE